jgi:hypothetical protein
MNETADHATSSGSARMIAAQGQEIWTAAAAALPQSSESGKARQPAADARYSRRQRLQLDEVKSAARSDGRSLGATARGAAVFAPEARLAAAAAATVADNGKDSRSAAAGAVQQLLRLQPEKVQIRRSLKQTRGGMPPGAVPSPHVASLAAAVFAAMKLWGEWHGQPTSHSSMLQTAPAAAARYGHAHAEAHTARMRIHARAEVCIYMHVPRLTTHIHVHAHTEAQTAHMHTHTYALPATTHAEAHTAHVRIHACAEAHGTNSHACACRGSYSSYAYTCTCLAYHRLACPQSRKLSTHSSLLTS